MAAVLALPDAQIDAMFSTICDMVRAGKSITRVLPSFGISWATWCTWRDETPQRADAFARAQEGYAEHLVLECPLVANDEAIDPKRARVIVDANLRVAALLCPRRFSQAAVDRIAAPPPADTPSSPEEVAAVLWRALTLGKPAGALPEPVTLEGDFEVVDG